MTPEQQEIGWLRKEAAKYKAERDILNEFAAFFTREAIWALLALRSNQST